MASIYITSQNLKGRINGVAKDAQLALAEAQRSQKELGGSSADASDLYMAAKIIVDANEKANKYLEKIKGRRN